MHKPRTEHMHRIECYWQQAGLGGGVSQQGPLPACQPAQSLTAWQREGPISAACIQDIYDSVALLIIAGPWVPHMILLECTCGLVSIIAKLVPNPNPSSTCVGEKTFPTVGLR